MEFATPQREMKKRKGNIIFNKLLVKANFLLKLIKPGNKIFTIRSEKKIPNAHRNKNTTRMNKVAAPLNLFLFASDSILFISLYNGINEEFNAPSVKILLKILGTEKAAKNISANNPAPKDLAIRTSLPKPRTRLISVAKLTFPVKDNICL